MKHLRTPSEEGLSEKKLTPVFQEFSHFKGFKFDEDVEDNYRA